MKDSKTAFTIAEDSSRHHKRPMQKIRNDNEEKTKQNIIKYKPSYAEATEDKTTKNENKPLPISTNC